MVATSSGINYLNQFRIKNGGDDGEDKLYNIHDIRLPEVVNTADVVVGRTLIAEVPTAWRKIESQNGIRWAEGPALPTATGNSNVGKYLTVASKEGNCLKWAYTNSPVSAVSPNHMVVGGATTGTVTNGAEIVNNFTTATNSIVVKNSNGKLSYSSGWGADETLFPNVSTENRGLFTAADYKNFQTMKSSYENDWKVTQSGVYYGLDFACDVWTDTEGKTLWEVYGNTNAAKKYNRGVIKFYAKEYVDPTGAKWIEAWANTVRRLFSDSIVDLRDYGGIGSKLESYQIEYPGEFKFYQTANLSDTFNNVTHSFSTGNWGTYYNNNNNTNYQNFTDVRQINPMVDFSVSYSQGAEGLCIPVADWYHPGTIRTQNSKTAKPEVEFSLYPWDRNKTAATSYGKGLYCYPEDSLYTITTAGSKYYNIKSIAATDRDATLWRWMERCPRRILPGINVWLAPLCGNYNNYPYAPLSLDKKDNGKEAPNYVVISYHIFGRGELLEKDENSIFYKFPSYPGYEGRVKDFWLNTK